jgi:hypothetical protein
MKFSAVLLEVLVEIKLLKVRYEFFFSLRSAFTPLNVTSLYLFELGLVVGT